jgi:hypothetical protein
MNPDSEVAIDRKREAQSFRSEVDGFLPLSRHRSALLRGGWFKPHRNDVRERKTTLKLHSRTPSLLQDSTSLPAFSSTAEFGLRSLRSYRWTRTKINHSLVCERVSTSRIGGCVWVLASELCSTYLRIGTRGLSREWRERFIRSYGAREKTQGRVLMISGNSFLPLVDENIRPTTPLSMPSTL